MNNTYNYILKNIKKHYIYIIHIIIVGPLLIYAGHIGSNNCMEQEEDGEEKPLYKRIFNVLKWMGIIVTVYHIYLLYKKSKIY